jgi:hypothetical protein
MDADEAITKIKQALKTGKPITDAKDQHISPGART